VNNLKIFRIFVGNIENSPLLLGKLMVSSKGWRKGQKNFKAHGSVAGESCILSTPPTPTWLSGNIMKGGNFP